MKEWPKFTDSQWLDETKRRLAVQASLRERLNTSKQFDENALRSLDSALKKTTAFMKKLKALNGASVPSLIGDLTKLNLSKFVDEMAMAITETKIKASEVAAITDLCVELASKYAKFPEMLLNEIKKLVPLKKADKVTNPAKLRIDIRFLTELILAGVVGKEGLQVLGATINYLTATDKAEHANVGLICSFCRPLGWQIAGTIPLPENGQPQVSVAKDDLDPGSISEDHKKTVRTLFTEYYSSLVQRLEKACASMNVVQKRVKKQERTRGDASAEDRSELEVCRTLFDKLKAQAQEMSSTLGVPLKSLNEEPSDDEEDELAALEMDKALADGHVSMWPDEEARRFYRNILEIRRILPKNLYKDSEEKTVVTQAMETCMDAINLEGLDFDAVPTDGDHEPEKMRTPSPPLPQPDHRIHELTPDQETVLAPSTAEMKAHMIKFIANMDHLVNRDITDDAALDFVSNLNTISNRKKLVKLLVGSPASRMDLLPFYGRMVAVLQPVMPDVAAEVTNCILKQFKDFVLRVSPEKERVEEKIKCVMLIGELVKFEVIPRAEALSCLRQLVYDFRGHSIEMACALIETAGYYLYRNSDSHPKMKIILEVVLAKKERVKDVRYVMLIDNAFYACVPPDNATLRRKEEPPMKLFIKHQVLDIKESNVVERVRCLRRINWADDEVSEWALRYLSSPWLIPNANLRALASMLTGLSGMSNHDWIGVWVVDAVCENIRLSLEVPGVYNQQAMACITYIGELYNYSGCDSAVIFKILYQLISFPEFDDASWQDFYRIRMICELLNTVGEFFQSGGSKKKMDCFLSYFHRFYWFKKEQWTLNLEEDDTDPPVFPADIKSEYINSTSLIRPGSRLPVDLTAAVQAVDELEAQLKENMDVPIDEDLEMDEEEGRRGQPSNDRGLHHIVEEDEEEADEEREGLSYANAVKTGEGFYSDDEKVNVHVDHQETQAEDEEFMRELDRIMHESHRQAPTQAQAPSTDMSVSAAVRQRFQRSIHFEDGDESSSRTKVSTSRGTEEPKVTKVALMSRGKGNKAVLKTVSIDEERLHRTWQAEKEREQRERADVKRVTLGHTARIIAEEAEEEQRKAMALGAAVPRKLPHFYKSANK